MTFRVFATCSWFGITFLSAKWSFECSWNANCFECIPNCEYCVCIPENTQKKLVLTKSINTQLTYRVCRCMTNSRSWTHLRTWLSTFRRRWNSCVQLMGCPSAPMTSTAVTASVVPVSLSHCRCRLSVHRLHSLYLVVYSFPPCQFNFHMH